MTQLKDKKQILMRRIALLRYQQSKNYSRELANRITSAEVKYMKLTSQMVDDNKDFRDKLKVFSDN